MKKRLEDLYEATHAARVSATKLNHAHHEMYVDLQDENKKQVRKYTELLHLLISLNSLRKQQKADPLITHQWYLLWQNDRFAGIAQWYPSELSFQIADYDYSGPFMRKIPADDWTLINIPGTHLNPFS